MAPAEVNDDFVDMLRACVEAEVEFVIVDAHALAVHGIARATGDIDILVRPTPSNADRVIAALQDFGAPLDAHGITARDFQTAARSTKSACPRDASTCSLRSRA